MQPSGPSAPSYETQLQRTRADIKNILVSTGKITSRAEKIEKVELAPAEEPKALI